MFNPQQQQQAIDQAQTQHEINQANQQAEQTGGKFNVGQILILQDLVLTLLVI